MTDQPCPQHFPYGKVFQTEHFDLLVKRCRICDTFLGVETAERKDVAGQVKGEAE